MTSIAVSPIDSSYVIEAVREGGVEPEPFGPRTEGLIWTGDMHADDGAAGGLAAAVAGAPGLRWLQLPSAGVDALWNLDIDLSGVVVTSAKGAFARPVAEHALTLALAGLRVLHKRIRARSWGASAGTSLYGERVTIVGAGGIAVELVRLLEPFGVVVTVVRRGMDRMPGASRSLPTERLHEALSDAGVVVLAAPLTDASRRMIGAAELAAMRADAWLVNVARGGLVDTDALVAALTTGGIAGAAIDVSDPEPLPDGHPLWGLDNCIVTPHTADTREMTEPLLAQRITENVRRFSRSYPLVGVVDMDEQY